MDVLFHVKNSKEHNRKLKFGMLIYMTPIHNIFEYCRASVILGNVDVLYLEDIYRPVREN